MKKIIIPIIIIAIGVFVGCKWQTWFGNPEEPQYEPLSAPGRVMLTFGDDSALSRNINWQASDKLQEAFVELKDDSASSLTVDSTSSPTDTIQANGEVFESRGGKAAYYTAKLRNLKPGTTYQYRVWTGGKCTPWYTFNTYNKDENHYAFMYVGDVQDTNSKRVNKTLLSALRAHQGVEFCVFGGDLVERPIDYHWQEVYDGLDTIRQSYPVMTVTGNHDYLKSVICTLEKRFQLIFSYFLDSQVGVNQVYTLKYNDMQLFFLDSNREFFYLFSQRAWLKEQMSKSKARWKIVVLHHPLHSVKGRMNNLIQRWMFKSLIEEEGVDIVLQGHEHSYARKTVKNDDDRTTAYVISHCSGKNYIPKNEDDFDIFSTQGRYYQVISVVGDTLRLSAYDADSGLLFDKIEKTK